MHSPRSFLHTSNRMEDLAGMLASLLRDHPGDPFQAETILVQSRGMGRWLSLQLADARGICLNTQFPFPREIVEKILEELLPQWNGAPTFRRETMVWKIFRLLGAFRGVPEFRAIAHYLEGDDLMKRLQLAERVGHLFDQYLMYRPDWLMRWERDEEDTHWQARLWRRLAGEADTELHLGRAWDLLRNGKRSVSAGTVSAKLPPRLCVFGISSLPPFFLEVLQRYASFGELHLFLLQPTDQYWGDLVSKKKQARLNERASAAAVYLEEGHPLVASLGKQGQDLLNLLIDSDVQQSEDRECFRETVGESSMLADLQTDILQLTDRSGDADKIVVSEADGSIEVHSCHSPMREVEVLRDQLLDRFQKDRSLRPRDVLVMIPDIEAYAPYVQAVFGGDESAGGRIPFAVVDRRPRSAQHAIDAWFRLLELAGGRFGAREVLALLETPPFRLRFGFSDRDVSTLRGWMQATGIRWGVDAAHREEQGLPAIAETTWQNGIDQWLLGFAMRAHDASGRATAFHGVFPFDEVEGGNTEKLDTFLGALDFLFRVRATMAKARSLEDWCEVLSGVLEDLFGGVEEVAGEVVAIRAAIHGLRETARDADVGEWLPLDVIRHFLEKTIDETVSGGGFLSGGVTFCTLQPMRTVPARVICLLGMDNDAFPRRPQQVGFDLMRDEPRIGDRSVREDDRYLFLETLLSAREALLISYVGQSARDLSEVPPSVLVSELLDHLDRVCRFPDGQSVRKFLVVRHRLQPFHPAYFAGRRLFTYSAESADACRSLMGDRGEEAPFFDAPLSEPEGAWRTVSVSQLVRFFRNPAEYFVKARLGLNLPREEAMLEDAERFSLNSLDHYNLKKGAFDDLLVGRDTHDWQRLQSKGSAPLGSPGRAICEAVQRDAAKFFAHVKAVTDTESVAENWEIDRRLGEFHLRGEIGPFHGGDLVSSRPSSVKPKDRVAAWVLHLIACWESGIAGKAAPRTVIVGEDAVVTLLPPEDAEESLRALLDFYWRGLSEPLPFFPACSWAYEQRMQKDGNETAAVNEALKLFVGSAGGWGHAELEDPYVALCWERKDPEEIFGEDFAELSSAIFRGFREEVLA